jgi:hypothetical protein
MIFTFGDVWSMSWTRKNPTATRYLNGNPAPIVVSTSAALHLMPVRSLYASTPELDPSLLSFMLFLMIGLPLSPVVPHLHLTSLLMTGIKCLDHQDISMCLILKMKRKMNMTQTLLILNPMNVVSMKFHHFKTLPTHLNPYQLINLLLNLHLHLSVLLGGIIMILLTGTVEVATH